VKINDGSRIAHSIYFILEERTDANRKKCIAACREYLAQHPGISRFSIGTLAEDLRRGVNDQSFDVAMNLVFENQDAYLAYLDDPTHEEWFKKTKGYVLQGETRVFDSYLIHGNPRELGDPKELISDKQIEDLSSKLQGYALEPSDSRYRTTTQIDNGRVQLHPGVVVLPSNANDIVQTLRFVRDNHLPFTIKAGGHSAAGYCLNDRGVVLDMLHLNKITFDKKKETVTVGMGARWKAVYEHMEDTGTGLIPVGGGCPTVAPAGFIQGGGYSFVSRSYGMGVDNLLSLTIITPDCERRVVGVDSTSAEDRDLFWACRGGGGGNFGIVTEMTLRVQKPHSKKMLVGQIQFPIEQGPEVIEYYNEWVETLPDAMAVYGRWGKQPDAQIQQLHDAVIVRRRPPNQLNPDPLKKLKVVSLTPVFNGPFEEGMDLLHDLLKLGPINANLFNMTLPEWEEYNGFTTLVANRSAYIKSLILKPGTMTAKVAKIFVKYMSSPRDENNCPNDDSFVVWTHAGGAISRKSPEETAFWHRDARFIPELKAIWDIDQPGDTQKNVEWANKFFAELAQESDASGAYVNYIDPLLHDWPRMYYGDNYERLETIKRKIDPDNIFSFQQSIGSTFNPPRRPSKDLTPLDRTSVDNETTI